MPINCCFRDCKALLSTSPSHVKCTKIRFRSGLRPDPSKGAHSAPSDLLAALKGPSCKGRCNLKETEKVGRKGKKTQGEAEGKIMRREGKEVEGTLNDFYRGGAKFEVTPLGDGSFVAKLTSIEA